MGRARNMRQGYIPRGIYAMGAPRTDMSDLFSTSEDMQDNECEEINMDNTTAVNSVCLIYGGDVKHSR